jgi:hypothetical protein
MLTISKALLQREFQRMNISPMVRRSYHSLSRVGTPLQGFNMDAPYPATGQSIMEFKRTIGIHRYRIRATITAGRPEGYLLLASRLL